MMGKMVFHAFLIQIAMTNNLQTHRNRKHSTEWHSIFVYKMHKHTSFSVCFKFRHIVFYDISISKIGNETLRVRWFHHNHHHHHHMEIHFHRQVALDERGETSNEKKHIAYIHISIANDTKSIRMRMRVKKERATASEWASECERTLIHTKKVPSANNRHYAYSYAHTRSQHFMHTTYSYVIAFSAVFVTAVAGTAAVADAAATAAGGCFLQLSFLVGVFANRQFNVIQKKGKE